MSQKRETLIYTLIDPRTDEIRYIGKTVQRLSNRLACHIYIAPQNKNYKSSWISGLIKKGVRPEIKLIERVPPDKNWMEREQYWISFYREAGAKLTNMTDGGDGTNGFTHTDEAKRKIGQASSRMVYSSAHRQRSSIAKVGCLNPQNKLSSLDVEKIREFLAQGMKQYKIAKRFNIGQPHVSRIKTGAYLKKCRFNTMYGGTHASRS